jgi:hypothetical protein
VGSLGNKRKSTTTGSTTGLSKPEYADDGAKRMPGLSSAYSTENMRQKILDNMSKSGRTSTKLAAPGTKGTMSFVNTWLGGTL